MDVVFNAVLVGGPRDGEIIPVKGRPNTIEFMYLKHGFPQERLGEDELEYGKLIYEKRVTGPGLRLVYVFKDDGRPCS